MDGVVACEKDIFLKVCVAGLAALSTEDDRRLRGTRAADEDDAALARDERPMLYSQRTESIVGMSSDGNCLPSSLTRPSKVHVG